MKYPSTLTVRQQQIVVGFAAHHHDIACLIAGNETALDRVKSSSASGSGLRVGRERYWYDTTAARGISITRPGKQGRGEVDVVRWEQLLNHIAALPDSLRTHAARFDRWAHLPGPCVHTPRSLPWQMCAFDPEELAWRAERHNRARTIGRVLVARAFPDASAGVCGAGVAALRGLGEPAPG